MRTEATQRAMTLIEMVIVLGIIMILSGIVWSVLAPVREKGRQAVCVSNLNQLNRAIQMYRQDHNGVDAEIGQRYWPRHLGLPLGLGSLWRQGYLSGTNREMQCPSYHRRSRLRVFPYELIATEVDKCFSLPPPRTFSYWVSIWGDEYPLIWDRFHSTQYWDRSQPRLQLEMTLGGRFRTRTLTWTPKYWWLGPPPQNQ